jgi:hypothetical protein
MHIKYPENGTSSQTPLQLVYPSDAFTNKNNNETISAVLLYRIKHDNIFTGP